MPKAPSETSPNDAKQPPRDAYAKLLKITDLSRGDEVEFSATTEQRVPKRYVVLSLGDSTVQIIDPLTGFVQDVPFYWIARHFPKFPGDAVSNLHEMIVLQEVGIAARRLPETHGYVSGVFTREEMVTAAARIIQAIKDFDNQT